MAKPKVSKGLTDSILTGSDEVFEFFCQPCSTEKHVEAAGFCQQCNLYLCERCVNRHGKLPLTKHHKMLGKASMPKTKPTTKLQTFDNQTETCKNHPGKILEYYCKMHSTICCSACLTLEHSSCSDTSYIPDISDNFANIQVCKTKKAQLDRLIVELTQKLSSINDEVKHNERCNSKALDDIKEFRQRVNKFIDEIENDTRKQVLNIYRDNEDILKKTSQEFQSLLSEFKSMATDIERNSNAGKYDQVFVQLQLSSKRISEAQAQVNESGLCKALQFTFKYEERLQEMKATLSALWALTVREMGAPTKARYLREICVKSGADAGECYISGIAALAGDRVLVTDYTNKVVKLMNTKTNTLISRLTVSSKPFDIAKINPNKIAVALGHEQKIEMINVSNTLSSCQTIETPKAKIAGLYYDGSNFIAACQNPGSVKIIDMSGSTLSTFATDCHGHHLFTSPRHIAFGRDKDVAYITDKDTNTVTCMTTGGHVFWVYTHDQLKRPWGVVVGRHGCVYVCSKDTHTVHQLSAGGGLAKILLSQEQGLASYPRNISVDEESDVLYISSRSNAPENHNYIRLFQLE